MHTLEGGDVLGYQQVGSQISPPFQYYDKYGDVHELRRARGAGVGTKASDVFGLEDIEDKSDTGSDYSDNCEPVSSKCVGLSCTIGENQTLADDIKRSFLAMAKTLGKDFPVFATQLSDRRIVEQGARKYYQLKVNISEKSAEFSLDDHFSFLTSVENQDHFGSEGVADMLNGVLAEFNKKKKSEDAFIEVVFDFQRLLIDASNTESADAGAGASSDIRLNRYSDDDHDPSKSYATREIELSGSSVTVIMQDASGGAQGPCGLLAVGNCVS